MEPTKLLTVREVANIMRVAEITVYKWVEKGTIKHVKIGRTIRIKEDDLNKMLGE